MKIEINGLEIHSKEDFYEKIRECLELPDYFGNNLDALYDILTERDVDLSIDFTHYKELKDVLEERFLQQLLRLLRDAEIPIRRYYNEADR